MNNCNLTGKLTKDAAVRGTDPKVLTFVLESRMRPQDGDQKERIALLPCLIFNPSAEIERMLVQEGKGLHVEFEGRLSSSAYDVKGDIRHTCEVIVRPWTLVIQPAFVSAG